MLALGEKKHFFRLVSPLNALSPLINILTIHTF